MKNIKRLGEVRIIDAGIMGGGLGYIPFQFTCVTTGGGQTLTLQKIQPTGSNLTINWGDTQTTVVTDGDGTSKTHVYTDAGSYVVTFDDPSVITQLDLRDTKIVVNLNESLLPSGLTSLYLKDLGVLYNVERNPLPTGLTSLTLNNLSSLTYNVNNAPLPSGLTSLSLISLTGLTYDVNSDPLPSGITGLFLNSVDGLTYNANTDALPAGITTLSLQNLTGLVYNVNTDPLPTGLTILFLTNISGITYNVNTNPLPTGLTFVSLTTLPNITWDIEGSAPWPTGATTATVITCPNITISEWTDNTIRTIRFESALSQAQVDSIINAVWTNKANFTYATPLLDILGGSMAAPSGTYQPASPPTTGKEKIYDLVNGNYTPEGPEWTVQYQS